MAKEIIPIFFQKRFIPNKNEDDISLIGQECDSHRYGSNDETVKDSNDRSGHCHTPSNVVSENKHARTKLIVASILCLMFMVGEIVGGFMAHSLAILTDAAHLLTDFASFMISLLAIYLVTRPATKKMSFGWHRAEVVGALASVLLIWVVTGILVYLAVMRIINADYEIKGLIMLITSVIGIVINLIMAATLHQGHSHGKTHKNEEGGGGSENSKKVNINVRAAFIHVLGDLVQSVGVFVAALIIYFKPQYKIVDPICTFIFSILVLITTLNILRDTILVLMEGTPKDINFNEVKDAFKNVPGVIDIHNLRIWSLTLNKTALSVHVAIDPEEDQQTILRNASNVIKQNFQIYDITIQLETYANEMIQCAQCQDPPD